MSAPIQISREIRRALNAEHRRRRDAIDRAAECEGSAADALADYDVSTSAPLQPHVRIGLMIDTALAYRKVELPAMPRNERENLALRGWFHRRAGYRKTASTAAMERVTAGGEGKREIVTRQDKVRRAINAAARRLDVLAATFQTSDPIDLQAVVIAKKLLRRTA